MSSHYYSPTGELVDPWTPGAYPSPSTILDLIRNDGIDAFIARAGEEVAEAHMVNTRDRGTRVHKACEIYANTGDADLAMIQANLEGQDFDFFLGFMNWCETFKPEIISTETFLINDTLKYAGTCDLIVRIDSKLWLIDIKTGMTRVKHGLQVKFYQEAYRDRVKAVTGTCEPMRMACLYLDAKRACGYRYFRSEYGMLEYKESLAAIKAHIAVFRWWAKKEPVKKPVEGIVWAG